MKKKKIGSVFFRFFHLIKEGKQKRMYFYYILGGITGGFVPILTAFYSKLIIDIITGSKDINTLIWTVVILMGTCIICYAISFTIEGLIHSSATYVRTMEFGRCIKMMHDEDYELLENPKWQDEYEIAMNCLGGDMVGFQAFYQGLYEIIQEVISCILFIVILSIYQAWIILVILVSTILFSIGNTIFVHYKEKMQSELAHRNRYTEYYYKTLSNFKYGKDIRVFSLKDYLLGRYEKASLDYVNVIRKIYNKDFKAGFLGLLALLIQDGFAYYLIIRGYFNHQYDIAIVSLYLTAFVSFSTVLRGLVTHTSTIRVDMKSTTHYFGFVDHFNQRRKEEENKRNAFDKTIPIEIEFSHVWFKYPASEDYVIKDFNFKISKGEKLAIVGTNGAGKTTIIKLITGLYQPQKGEIKINGISQNEFKKSEYYKMFATVFQDFEVYGCSLLENVCGLDKDEASIERAKECLNCVGLEEKIKELPKGYDSVASKVVDEEGVDFSGGQKQKIAIARALYKDANVVILDEPTAALDALAEAQIYQNFDTLVTGKTAIYISHRLSSTKFCNKILFFSKDGLEEYGTHDELMDLKGKYHDMFVLQGKYYQEGGQSDEQK